MSLFIHNTLTRQKEEFKPIDAKNIRVYACGPTVYNYAHIGNGRAAVVFDLLVRVLRHAYGKNHVQYVRNITDIDDKIMDKAQETGEDIKALTERYAKIYNEDMGALGVQTPDHQPKATDFIPHMIAMVEKLIAAGHAYAAEGHVLFHVPSWNDYGQLSRRSRDDLVAGARVEVAPYKKDPADFILWKPSSPEQVGWDSPWGRGRPGWHLECSAMNESINGEHFDIHAGGEDLIFPHHENEIAQSVCAHGYRPYVNYWMHNGHLMAEGAKMSKSLGNVYLVHDLVKQHPPEAIRYFLLSAHYRQPFDFTLEGLTQARRTLDRYYGLLRDAQNVAETEVTAPSEIIQALEDDLNTPKALAELAVLAKSFSTAQSPTEKERYKGDLLAAGELLGLLQQTPAAWFQSGGNTADNAPDGENIERLIQERADAKKSKNFARADEIRKQLAEQGVILEDSATGTRWKRA